jgi:anti-anti-sigma factor
MTIAGGALIMEEGRAGKVCVIALGGRLDSTNSEQLMARLKSVLASAESSVLLDLSRVVYLTSAAFRALLVAAREADRSGARFVLCSVLGQVRELFEMGDLLDAFTIHNSRDEALAAFG